MATPRKSSTLSRAFRKTDFCAFCGPGLMSAPSVARLHVAGMDCADEAALVRHALARPGIRSLNFDLVGRRVDVTFDADRISAAAILASRCGHRADRAHPRRRRSRRRRSRASRSPSRHGQVVGRRERRACCWSAGGSTACLPRAGPTRCSAIMATRPGWRSRASSGGDGRVCGVGGDGPVPDGAARVRVAALPPPRHARAGLPVDDRRGRDWAVGGSGHRGLPVRARALDGSVEHRSRPACGGGSRRPRARLGRRRRARSRAGGAVDRAVRRGLHAAGDLRRSCRGAGPAAGRRPVGWCGSTAG